MNILFHAPLFLLRAACFTFNWRYLYQYFDCDSKLIQLSRMWENDPARVAHLIGLLYEQKSTGAGPKGKSVAEKDKK